jgi:hypothetical protein
MNDLTRHYETLGLEPGASIEEIQKAYYISLTQVVPSGELPTSGPESDKVVALYSAHFALICEEQRLPKQEAV